jgi:hypothetical protein
VYRNTLVLNSAQSIDKDTEGKIREYLKDHISNFKPAPEKTCNLIEQIRQQNSEIIKSREKNSKLMLEIVKEKEKLKKNQEIKKKLNFKILPNLGNSRVLLDLDVQYDFVPCNEEYLRRMRLDFAQKYYKIADYIFRKQTANAHMKIFLTNSFQHDYQEWRKKLANVKKMLSSSVETSNKMFGLQPCPSTERLDIWNNRKKDKDIKSLDDAGYEREMEMFKLNKAEIPRASFNLYSGEFYYVTKSLKKIHNPIVYDQKYKSADIWTPDDISKFITKYLTQPKDFDAISSSFENKTTRDIIDFYHNFRFHLNLKKHTEELFAPTYLRRPLVKKLEHISTIAASVLAQLPPPQSLPHLPQTKAYTSAQLIEIFSKLSAERDPQRVEKHLEKYEEN